MLKTGLKLGHGGCCEVPDSRKTVNPGEAVEWKVIALAPSVRLMKEAGRELTIDPETEARLLVVVEQPMRDVLMVIQDTGMRPDEVFRIRIENIDWIRASRPKRRAGMYPSANECWTC